ncbi:MAG: PAS domain-containing protein, partial [Rhodospirillaceae bacterium]|nr:PAS domain-containing protein [Rhodospirillaceae bacterium]
ELEAVVVAGQSILAGLPDPLILLDGEARIVRANPAAEALFEGPLAGRDLFAVLRAPPVMEAVDAVLGGGAGRVVEVFLPVPVERIFSVRVEPLSAPAADGTAALLTLHDLTHVRRADRMRADFVANASHELHTPLSTLIGFIETLQGPARDDAEARARFLAIMHDQATRMARLVADLLSLSRIELNEHTAPATPVDVGKVLRGVVATLQLKAAARDMEIVLGVPPPGPELALRTPGDAAALDALPPVLGDADELAQVLQNLIDNAIKYGRAGTPVGIAAWVVPPAPARRLAGPALAVAVIDRGEGIPRPHLPRLTERFYRVDTARSRDLGGTGLGLAIVKHILNRHRGRLDIASVPGVGSAFTVYLPLAPGAPGDRRHKSDMAS